MPQVDVERAVQRGERRNEKDEVSAPRQDRREIAQRLFVALDVLEDIEADDRVDRIPRQFRPRGGGEGEFVRGDSQVAPPFEFRLQLADVVGFDV